MIGKKERAIAWKINDLSTKLERAGINGITVIDSSGGGRRVLLQSFSLLSAESN